MTAILAGAGRIAGARHGISGKIIFGLQAAAARLTGREPVRFVASARPNGGPERWRLVIARFSRADCRTVAGRCWLPGFPARRSIR